MGSLGRPGIEEKMAPRSKTGEVEKGGESLSPTLVKGDSIHHILDAGHGGTRNDLLLAATRELATLLGDRGFCVLLESAPRIVAAPSDPMAVGRSLDLEQYPEIGEALRVRDVVVLGGGSSIAVPLFDRGRCLSVILVESEHPHRVTGLDLATARVVARLTAVLLLGAEELEGLVIASLPPSPSTPISVTLPQPASARQRILMVEDDVATADTLIEALENNGYLVEHARDGREGIKCALSIHPDLILLDVNLPVLDGFMAAAELRQSLITREIPIIFLSARPDLSAQVRVLRFQSVDFIPKPFSRADLLARIEQALSGAQARQRLQRRAAVDELTGLGNLRTLRARLEEEYKRASRYGNPLSLAMIDVDKLKVINDQHGHQAGSEVLRAIGDVLRRHARTTDLAVRYGGDEFVVLLPHTTLTEAAVFAERVRSEVARRTVQGLHATVSIGIASLSQPNNAETDAQLLKRADAAAYAAKRRGGNRICVESELSPAGSVG